MGKMFFDLTGIYHYMSEDYNLSPFFKRRIDHHKFEKMMRKGIGYIYFESKSLEEFKYKLVKATLENYIHYKYNIEIEDQPQDDVDNFIDYMIKTYDSLLKGYYYDERKSRGGINESINNKLSKETMTETFQDIVDETLEEIKHNCEELDTNDFPEWLSDEEGYRPSACDVVDTIDKISIVNIERRKGISTIPMFEVDLNLTFNSISEWIDYDDFIYLIADRIINKWRIHFIFNIKEQENSNKREMWEYARTLKNARQQGSKLRFPKSAIKANPMRFRPYNR
jgi:hypothetical protein